MKKNHVLLTFLSLLFSLNSLKAQTTFDWENATDNDTTIEQTVNGVTATFTVNSNDPWLLNARGFAGSSGFIIAANNSGEINSTIVFSSPINITSIYSLEGLPSNNTNQTWTFIPTGGSNSNIMSTIPPYGTGVTINLNWTDVTGITITSSNNNVLFGFDNIISDFTLSTQEFNTSKSKLIIFPNPSTDYLQISGLTKIEKYKVYSILGTEISNGIISNNEKINVQNLTNGFYLLKVGNGKMLKFLKK